MSVESRRRERAIVRMLVASSHLNRTPQELATNLSEFIGAFVTGETYKAVILATGDVLAAQHLIRVDVIAWAIKIFTLACIPFPGVTATPPAVIEAIATDIAAELSTVNTMSLTAMDDLTVALTDEIVERVNRQMISRRPYLAMLTASLEEGLHTHKELLDTIITAFPQFKRSSIDQILFDLRNYKYSVFKNRTVVKDAAGKLIFFDQVVLDKAA